MGSHMVVLNNSDVAADLLERRSLIYSDRVRNLFGECLVSQLNFHRYPPLATNAHGK